MMTGPGFMRRLPIWKGIVGLLLGVLLSGCAAPGSLNEAGPMATEVLSEWKRADRFYARGEFLKARDSYQVVLEREPDNNDVLFRLANIAYYMQDREEARELYARVVDSGLNDPQLFYNRAALNLTEAYNDLARYRDEGGPSTLTPEIRAVMAAIERMSTQRPVLNTQDKTAPEVGGGEQ